MAGGAGAAPGAGGRILRRVPGTRGATRVSLCEKFRVFRPFRGQKRRLNLVKAYILVYILCNAKL